MSMRYEQFSLRNHLIRLGAEWEQALLPDGSVNNLLDTGEKGGNAVINGYMLSVTGQIMRIRRRELRVVVLNN